MEESSFQIRPYLDSSLVDFASSELIFLDHVDPNTGQTISDMQAGMVNTIQIRIKDIYGNEFTEGHDVSFMLKLTPESGAALSYISAFNSITLKYEFYAIPVKAGTTLVEVLETLSGQHLSGSPVNKTVIAGKYEPSKFLISAPSGSCYIAIDCILTLEMYDANSNKILSSGFLDTDFDIESLAIGPIGVPENQSTSRISTIVENAGTGTFSLTLIITKSGDYEIYTRVKSLQILSYPYQLEAVSNQASAPNSIITQSPVSPSMAGVTIIYNLEVYDEFDNLAVDEIIPSEAIMYLNENVTLTGIVTKTSTAQYTIQFDPTISGDYSLRIKIFDKSETYRFIKDMPQTQTIYPSYISASLSTYNGSGLNSGRFGFLEQFDLNIKDIYDNLYHEEYIFYGGTNQSVYKIEYLADDTDSKDVILISKTPTQGLYTLGYRIVNAYAQLYIRIWLYVSTDSGATYSYTQVNDFPIIVPIVFSPSDLLDEYTNLYQGGIGITEKSTSSILNNVTAGSGVTKFMEVSPKNAYSLSYVHDEVRDYLVVDYQTQGDGSELCLCQDLSDMSPSKLPQAYHNESSLAYTLKNCHKLSFSKNQCNLAGICLWDAASAQSQNFHSND